MFQATKFSFVSRCRHITAFKAKDICRSVWFWNFRSSEWQSIFCSYFYYKLSDRWSCDALSDKITKVDIFFENVQFVWILDRREGGSERVFNLCCCFGGFDFHLEFSFVLSNRLLSVCKSSKEKSVMENKIWAEYVPLQVHKFISKPAYMYIYIRFYQ